MCVAIPGKVLEINGSMGKIDFSGNTVDADISLVNVKLGDYVLIHAGCAIEVLKEDAAKEMISLFKELEEVLHD